MRYRLLILLFILGCSIDLAPPDSGITGEIVFTCGALESVHYYFKILDIIIESVLHVVKSIILYFCYRFEIYVQLFLQAFHDSLLLGDIVGQDSLIDIRSTIYKNMVIW